jgi:hypothetical protein
VDTQRIADIMFSRLERRVHCNLINVANSTSLDDMTHVVADQGTLVEVRASVRTRVENITSLSSRVDTVF